jgi:hypothetical protein
MKTKLSFIVLFCLSVLFLSSCQKKDVTPASNDDITPAPMNAKLKQVLLYSTMDSKEPISIVEEYEYGEAGRISKVSSTMYIDGTIIGTGRYDIYEYNSPGQLIKINNYVGIYKGELNAPTEFSNLNNTLFEYSSDGKKIKEKKEYPLAGISEYTDFEYTNGLLSKVSKYSHNILDSYMVYEYDKSNRVIKELSYTSDGKCLAYTIHTYKGVLQTKSDYYLYPSNDHFRSINRIFDKNNNLMALESKELVLYSSLMNHVLRYKYY